MLLKLLLCWKTSNRPSMRGFHSRASRDIKPKRKVCFTSTPNDFMLLQSSYFQLKICEFLTNIHRRLAQNPGKHVFYSQIYSQQFPSLVFFTNIVFMTRDRPIYRIDIWILPIHRYQPKRPIVSASVGVDKTLLYSSSMQTTCSRKHNEPSQDRLEAPLFHKQADKMNHGACIDRRSRNKTIIIN